MPYRDRALGRSQSVTSTVVTYFAVSERAHGELLDALDGDGMRAALPGLLAALDALRAIDTSGTEGYGKRCAAGLHANSEQSHRPPPTTSRADQCVGQDVRVCVDAASGVRPD